jgi:MarR family transcriptional regulator for hemolysin
MSRSSEQCARQVLDVVPLVMRAIRAEMRSHRTPDVSVSQFRTLVFLSRHEGASLSDVAEHIGLRLPSISKMVDGLVVRKLVRREEHRTDRRRVTLTLTRRGRAIEHRARAFTQSALAERLAALSARDHARIVQTMEMRRPLFAGREQDE